MKKTIFQNAINSPKTVLPTYFFTFLIGTSIVRYPYFIDADASASGAGEPIGGLTVITFPNNHLVYALTWFGLAAMLAGWLIHIVRLEKAQRQ